MPNIPGIIGGANRLRREGKTMRQLSIKRLSDSGSIRLILAAIVFVVFGIMTTYSAKADTQQLEESSFSWTGGKVVNDTAASSGQAMKLTSNDTGTYTTTTDAISAITIKARGDSCDGAPTMQVTLNGQVVAKQLVSGTAWTDYTFPVSAAAGNNSLKISLIDAHTAYWLWNVACVRTLYVDRATLTTEPVASPSPTTTPTPTPSSSPAPIGGFPAGAEYVAMGDSYGSGWGADRTPSNLTIDKSVYGNTSTTCGRSSKGAQVLVAADFNLTLKNVACGGANTDNLLSSGQFKEPAQLDNLSADTKLATITIGGNDSGLIWMLQVCVQNMNCVRADWGANWFIVQADAKIAALPAKIEKVLRAALQKAPNAKIRETGYPYIISPKGEATGNCGWLGSGAEAAYFQSATEATNNAIKSAVEKVAADTGRDVKYVDPLAADSPFMQRDNGQMLTGCSTSLKRYMNGPNDGSDGIWHPNIYGQQMYAQLIETSL